MGVHKMYLTILLLAMHLSDFQVFALTKNAVMPSMYTTLFEQLWLFC